MSDLSYKDELEIYKHLCKAYPVEDGYVIVWRGDKETKGADTKGGWYDKYANIDYEIYKTDGSIEIPEGNITSSEASALHRELQQQFPKDIIYIEAKTRKFPRGPFPQYAGLFMNNHLDDSLRTKYPIFLNQYPDTGKYYIDKHHPNRVVPPSSEPESSKGKINQTFKKLTEPGAKFFYIVKDGATGMFWVAELTTSLLNRIVASQKKEYSDEISQLSREGKGEPRWEKNYDITWDNWQIINNWNLDKHKSKPIDIKSLPAHIFEKRAVANEMKTKAKAEMDAILNLPNTKPTPLVIPEEAQYARALGTKADDIKYLPANLISKVNNEFKLHINTPTLKYEIKSVDTPGGIKKVIYENGTPVLKTPIYE